MHMIIKNKNLRLIVFGTFTSRVGSSIYTIALSAWLAYTTNTVQILSYVMAASTFTALIMNPLAGIICDRFEKKKLLIYTDIVSGIISVLISICCFVKYINVYLLIAAAVLLAICNTIFRPAAKAIIPEIVSHEFLVKANSSTTTTNELAGIIAPALAAIIFLASENGIACALFFNGITFLISAISENFIKYKSISIKSCSIKKISIRGEYQEIIGFYIKNIELSIIIAFSTIINIFCSAVNILLPLFCQKVLEQSESQYSLLLLFQGGGALAISFYLLTKKVNNESLKNLIKVICVYGIGLIVLNYSKRAETAFLAMFVAGGAIAYFNIFLFSYVQKKVPSNLIGKALAVIYTLALIVSPISYLFFGFLAEKIINKAFLILGLIVILISVLFLNCMKGRRKYENGKSNN